MNKILCNSADVANCLRPFLLSISAEPDDLCAIVEIGFGNMTISGFDHTTGRINIYYRKERYEGQMQLKHIRALYNLFRSIPEQPVTISFQDWIYIYEMSI